MKRLLAAIAIFACTIASAQDYGVVNISVCNMRDVPQYSAEMVSQAIMGTPVKILQRGGEYNWPEVQTPDTYTGWVHKDAIAYMSAEELHEWNAAPKVVVTALWSVVKNGEETVCDVVAGSRLKYIGKKGCSYKVALPDGRTGLLDIHRAFLMIDIKEHRQECRCHHRHRPFHERLPLHLGRNVPEGHGLQRLCARCPVHARHNYSARRRPPVPHRPAHK